MILQYHSKLIMKKILIGFTGVSSQVDAGLDNDKQSNGNEHPATPSLSKANTGTPTSGGGGEVKLRDRRRRESAPVIGMPDVDQAHPAWQVRGARRVSKGSQRAMLTSCLSEDSALEGLESVGDINTPKGSRRNFIELMMSSSPQVGCCFVFLATPQVVMSWSVFHFSGCAPKT